MKKTYPKVPRHDHGTVEDELYDADDLVLLEKCDGSNCRICLYDDRYADAYGESLEAFDPEDGDIFIGSKGNVRGRLSDDADDFDGNFGRLLTELREQLDADALRDLHAEYDSPVVLFGEHMVKHTLDYGYDESPPPAFLGFDVFRLTEYEDPPSNPFDERFDGFLDLDDAFTVFERAGLDTIRVIDRLDSGINPENITVPISSYGNLKAEGVVIRSDARSRRTKHVTETFREQMKTAWGMQEDDADSGEELFVARYLTNPRIRKTVHKLVVRKSESDVDAGTVAEAAVADAWEEEMYDIRDIGLELTPRDLYPLASERAEEIITTMQTNAELNDTTLDRLWEDVGEDAVDTDIRSFDVNTSVLSSLSATLKESDDVNRALVEELFHEQYVHSLAEDIASDAKREIGRWLIQRVSDECQEKLWYDQLGIIVNLPVAITPSEVDSEVVAYVREEINSRDDVSVKDGDEDWTPDTEDADVSGLDSLL